MANQDKSEEKVVPIEDVHQAVVREGVVGEMADAHLTGPVAFIGENNGEPKETEEETNEPG